MSCYETLAGCYDSLTEDVQYERRAEYLTRLLRRSKREIHSVLDLACGTGTMSLLLAQRGYRVLGVDLSEDMLAEAMNKALAMDEEQRPFFICQSMTALRLGEEVDAVICGLDSLNYLLRPSDVQRTFRRVAASLKSGGMFIFDVNTAEKLEGLDGQVFLDETEDTYCVWRAEYSRRSHIITYYMDLFRREKGERWRRSFEEHRERAYTREELSEWLEEAGFTAVRCYGDLSRSEPGAHEQRLYFSAIKE